MLQHKLNIENSEQRDQDLLSQSDLRSLSSLAFDHVDMNSLRQYKPKKQKVVVFSYALIEDLTLLKMQPLCC